MTTKRARRDRQIVIDIPRSLEIIARIQARQLAQTAAATKVIPTVTSVGCVYYIVDQRDNMFKIGYSQSPTKRLHFLRTASPFLDLVAVEDGDRELEAIRHRQFEEYRIRREWFRPGPRLVEHVRNLALVNSGGNIQPSRRSHPFTPCAIPDECARCGRLRSDEAHL